MIQELVIGGKSRPVRLGLAALSQFEEVTGKSFLKGADFANLQLKEMATLLRVSLIAGARQKNLDTADIPDEDGMLDWMDEGDVLLAFPKIVASQMQALASRLNPEAAEKNLKGQAKAKAQ